MRFASGKLVGATDGFLEHLDIDDEMT